MLLLLRACAWANQKKRASRFFFNRVPRRGGSCCKFRIVKERITLSELSLNLAAHWPRTRWTGGHSSHSNLKPVSLVPVLISRSVGGRAASGWRAGGRFENQKTENKRATAKRAARETLSLRQLGCALAPRTRVDFARAARSVIKASGDLTLPTERRLKAFYLLRLHLGGHRRTP